jgi:hypothetical protein
MTRRVRGDDGGTAVAKEWRRAGHRGWTVDNCAIPRHVKAFHGGFAKSAGSLKAFPEPLIWPTFNDLDGAKLMIDAVMGSDFDMLRELKADFPAHTFGFEVWMQGKIAEGVPGAGSRDRVLRTVALPRGFSLDMVLVQKPDRVVQVYAVVRNGRAVVSRRLLAQRAVGLQPKQPEGAL